MTGPQPTPTSLLLALEMARRMAREASQGQADSTMLADLGRSGMVDSLNALTSGAGVRKGPAQVVVRRSPNADAEYTPATDKVSVTSGLMDPNQVAKYLPGSTILDRARFALSHEFGHRADFKQYPDWASVLAMQGRQADARKNYGVERKGQVNLPDRSYDDQYGADTFATAFQFLQSPQSRQPGGMDRLSEIEKMQPGTSAIVYTLLRRPPYSKHPLAFHAIAPAHP